MSTTKRISLWIMAAFYCLAGFNHLMNPVMYVTHFPPNLPNPEWLNVIAGLAEILLGVYVLEPRTRVFAAWGIIALLIAIFPQNLHVALNNIGPDGPGTGSSVRSWITCAFQLVFVAWAGWYTRPEAAAPPLESR